MIFDSHAHYDDHQYDEDREQLLKELHNNGVERIVNVSAELEKIENVIGLAEKYDYIYATVGVHPDEVEKLVPRDIDRMRDYAGNSRVVAIGEIGLDYYEHEDQEPKNREVQKEWFRLQMNLARELNKPVIIHSRDACEDTLQILKDYTDVHSVMHCYSYSKETAKILLDMGFIFGIGGVVTFKNSKKLKEAVEYIPLESIILETDCPYLAPVPHRGTRNQSDYIRYVIDEIARIKSISPAEVEETCWNNTNRFYGLT